MLVQELQINFGFEELCTIFWGSRIVKDITFVLYLCLVKFYPNYKMLSSPYKKLIGCLLLSHRYPTT